MGELTHLDREGHPVMVDVSAKPETNREAVAEGWVHLPERVFSAILENQVQKGDVLKIAELAGIQGAKQTASLIPLCHGIRLDQASVRCQLVLERKAVHVECHVKAREVTGVEMEALTGVSVAALTVYDMCKALDKGIEIRDIRLLMKKGGKSGEYRIPEGV
ncbi:MAG TPA: cyclic pyranopterin monophosphate synthase MoaC [Synergistales bacterium]|nr:cyclic pyranopterin monophosphate synthase MoaC [Synergistales bacterium]